MGASFSTWARWDDTVVQQELAAATPPVQYSGPSMFQGAQSVTINGGTIIQNNQQGCSSKDLELLRKILDFLSMVNFRSTQQENLDKWAPETLKWIFESSMFQFWLDAHGAILWGTGMPGAGKTILASVMIEHMEDLSKVSGDICVGFVYCRYTEPMKVRDILAALVRQLIERFPHLAPVVEPLYAKHDLQRTNPTQKELIGVIRQICGCFRMAYLFIDGLDEALYDEQFDLLDTLKSVPANFFITSRPLVQLKDVLQDVEFFDIAARNQDIGLLVSQHIDRNPDLQQVLAADGQREKVIKKICESSCGMFLHASLMVEAVRHCTNSRHVMEQLDELPAELDLLYEEAFKRIEMQPEKRAALAKRVLLWVAYAYRPFTVNGLQYAVASNPKVDWATPEKLVPESLLISVCCGLVTVEGDESERIVRLIHYTALDPVKRVVAKWEKSPHGLLTELCLGHLLNYGRPPRRSRYQDAPQPPDYAYHWWRHHAEESIQCPAQPSAQPVPSILWFFATRKIFRWMDKHDGFTGDPWQYDKPTETIHLIVYYQLPCLLPLAHSQVNSQTQMGRSALSLTAFNNDVAMAELLLKVDGIDVNLHDMDGNTALMHAAQSASADLVKTLLLDPRINIHKRNEKGETALHCALIGSIDGWIDDDHTEAALHLIATPGIDINATDHPSRYRLPPRDNDGLAPLMHAWRYGTSSAVQWCLRLPGVEARDYTGVSALSRRA
ncbi:hypothetical protein BKA70DRAFT_1567390 [Coprinopsis sp. MPI-PUGE-AT-0042]|nr:hypothetical protein BKA70DRAFT_1567390 [Coprinopsis sp. MPI-PUGE-AT-0042]